MNRGTVKGRSHDTQLQILSQLPQELASFSLLFMICFLSCWATSLFLLGLHKSGILHSRRGRVLPVQLSGGLALSYSAKPPQPGSLVGPVMKSTEIISIKDRGQGWRWKPIDILIVGSSSFHRALTSQLVECGWSRAQRPSWVRAVVFGTGPWGGFWGPELLPRGPHHRKLLPSWLWCGGSKGWCL